MEGYARRGRRQCADGPAPLVGTDARGAGRSARRDEDIHVVEDRLHARRYGHFCGQHAGHPPVGKQPAESTHTAGPGLEAIRIWHLLYVVVDSPQEAWDEVRDDRRRRVVGVSGDDLVPELAQQHASLVDRRVLRLSDAGEEWWRNLRTQGDPQPSRG